MSSWCVAALQELTAARAELQALQQQLAAADAAAAAHAAELAAAHEAASTAQASAAASAAAAAAAGGAAGGEVDAVSSALEVAGLRAELALLSEQLQRLSEEHAAVAAERDSLLQQVRCRNQVDLGILSQPRWCRGEFQLTHIAIRIDARVHGGQYVWLAQSLMCKCSACMMACSTHMNSRTMFLLVPQLLIVYLSLLRAARYLQ
jgi:hypothetical protein